MKTAFIGHRRVFAKNIKEKLADAIRNEIDNGCRNFTMGVHGEFDNLALNACRQLKNKYSDLEVEIVITNLRAIEKDCGAHNSLYGDVKTVMYDIENVHYKQQITLSNRQMIDTCDTLICYVDNMVYKSGAKSALLYAEKRGLKIVNLYCEEDQPFYGMTQEQVAVYWKKLYEKVLHNKRLK